MHCDEDAFILMGNFHSDHLFDVYHFCICSLSGRVKSIVELLRELSGYEPNEKVVRRMRRIFGPQVLSAELNCDRQLASDIYGWACDIPQTETTRILNTEVDLFVDGSFVRGFTSILLCFHRGIPKALKILSEEQSISKMENLALVLHGVSHPNVASFVLIKRRYLYVIMDLFGGTVEEYTNPHPTVAISIWRDISAALRFLHEFGVAHMDVKPANIAIKSDGTFVLIDLDSTSRYGEETFSTDQFVPVELRKDVMIADPKTDWWMLATTLYQRNTFLTSLPAPHATMRPEDWQRYDPHPTQETVKSYLKNNFPQVYDSFLSEVSDA